MCMFVLSFKCEFINRLFFFLFFKQKTAYEMRISDWSSDVCSSDLTTGRIDALIEDGSLFGHPLTGPTAFDPATDRVMMCGSMAMIRDLQARFEELGFQEGSNAAPGDFVIERAFVG